MSKSVMLMTICIDVSRGGSKDDGACVMGGGDNGSCGGVKDNGSKGEGSVVGRARGGNGNDGGGGADGRSRNSCTGDVHVRVLSY